MTLTWIEHEIEQSAKADNTAQNVYDLAALLIVRDYFIKKASAPSHEEHVSPHDLAPDSMPTLDQVEMALGSILVNSESDKKRKQDAMTWAKILKGEG